MTTAVITIGSIVTARVFALLALRLRLRRQSHREQDRHRYLLGVAERLASVGQVELDDQDGDGHRLRVKITHVGAPGEGRAA